MRHASKNIFLVSGIISLLLTILFMGFSRDDEFSEPDIFLKYRPSFQVYFDSPLGMQDMPPDYPAELKEKQAVYDEFILAKHQTDTGIWRWLPLVLLAVTLGLLTTGIYSLNRKANFIGWRVMIYFFLCFIIVAVCTGMMLLQDNWWIYITAIAAVFILSRFAFLVVFTSKANRNGSSAHR